MIKAAEILEKIERCLLIFVLFLVPIVFFPQLPSFFETSKLVIFAGGVLLVLLITAVKIFLSGWVKFKLTNLDFFVILLAFAYAAAAVLRTPNKFEAFFLPGTVSLFIAGVVFFFLANNLFYGHENKKALLAPLFFSGVALSAASLIFISRILNRIPQIPAFLKNPYFSLVGGKLAEAIFLAALLPLGVGLLAETKESVKKIFLATCLGIIGLNLLLSIYSVLPGQPAAPVLPPLFASWSVAIDSIKESPVFGQGPGNYLSAFGRFAPIAYNNLKDLWSVRFTTANSFVLTILTETGFLGLLAFVLLITRLLGSVKTKIQSIPAGFNLESGIYLSLGLLILAFFLFPYHLSLVILFFVLLSLTADKKDASFNLLRYQGSFLASRAFALVVSLLLLVLIAVPGYFGSKALAAEFKYKQALDAVTRNNAKLAFETMVSAIQTNASVDRYHTSYGQMNLALANSIAQKKDLTDDDKTAITQLIQQAIAEGKAAVALNPQRAGNWENLGGIYRSVMAFAQGADSFAIQTYSQAIALDPINPNLRLSLGGIYYALGRYEDAVQTFQLATFSKPDLANARFNLAIALREKGDTQKAINELKNVLSLVEKDSADYKAVAGEIDNLTKKLPAKTTTATPNLTPPTPAGQPVIKPPLELPKEATPPAAQ